ncbi:MAG: hypothetical protein Q9163_003294 [Psora crenata]
MLGEAKVLNHKFSSTLKSLLGKRNPWADIPTTAISPAQATALAYILTLPVDTPLLATEIARLGSPLSRSESSVWVKELCTVHAWFEPKYLLGLTDLIARELWDRSEALYAFPKDFLCVQVREMLYTTLLPFRDLFRPRTEQLGQMMTAKPSGALNSRACAQQECIACALSLVFQHAAAVEALANLCKGRKRHHYAWPELLAFLEPIEYGKDEQWRRRWLREGINVRRERRKVRLWKECGGSNEASADSYNEGDERYLSRSPTPPNIALSPAAGGKSFGWSNDKISGPQGYHGQARRNLEDNNEDLVTGMMDKSRETRFEKSRLSDGGWTVDEEAPAPTSSEVGSARALAYRALHGERDTVVSSRDWEAVR